MFNNKIINIYEEEKYYVMGPRIIGYYKGEDQSPIKLNTENSKIDVLLQIIKNIIRLSMWKLNLGMILEKEKKCKIKRDNINKINGERYYDGILHGSCLIFSPMFLKNWDGFYENTFLYREEAIIFYILNKLQCKYVFSKEISIYHKSGASTNEVLKNNRKKKLFLYSNGIKSQIHQFKLLFINKDKLKKQL